MKKYKSYEVPNDGCEWVKFNDLKEHWAEEFAAIHKVNKALTSNLPTREQKIEAMRKALDSISMYQLEAEYTIAVLGAYEETLNDL